MEGQHVIGRLYRRFYDKVYNKVRISPRQWTASCRQRPTLLLDDDALTYLSPERYDGEKVTGLTDQYYLGLLGLELLLGKPPVDVATFANLEIKKQFFESPRLFFGELSSKQPAFSFVLARMLERKPEKRWASMSGLVSALQQIEAGEVPEVVRARADEDYSDKLRGNRGFFHSFYQRLFESSDEIGKLFDRRGVKLDDQYRKLDRAMGSLLNFNAGSKPRLLTRR